MCQVFVPIPISIFRVPEVPEVGSLNLSTPYEVRMSLPKLNWVRQNQISFDVGSIGTPAIVTGSDDCVYFAAFVQGHNPSLTVPPPSIQYSFNTYQSASQTYNLVVGKYYPNGPFTLVWYQYFYELTTTSDSRDVKMVIGAENELYVAFTTRGSTPQNLNMALVPTFGTCNCTVFGYDDVVLARIQTNGTPRVQWVVQSAYINSSNNESVPSIALDATNGLLYLAYQCDGNILCNPAVGTTNVLVSCFDVFGKQLWIETGENVNCSGMNGNPSVAADLSGGLYVAYEITAMVQGGKPVPLGSQQIEMVKFQNNVVSYGVIQGYSRAWVLSDITDIFTPTGISLSPVLTFRTNTLYLACTTTGTVSGGTHTGSAHDIVIGSFQRDGNRIWLHQGPQFNQPAYAYTDCFLPYITTDEHGFVYVSFLTLSATYENVLLLKLDVATGTPYYDTTYQSATYNAYPLARQYAPNTAFPLPYPAGSFSKTVLTFNGLDMYAILTTKAVGAGQTKTSPAGAYDLCFLAYDRILVLISTSPFSFMTKNKSICACAGACGCSQGLTLPSIVYGVRVDPLTSASTALSSSWYINIDSATVVQYWTTGGTTVGPPQSVASGTTTHTLAGFPPMTGTYYYVTVTPQYGTTVTSDPVQMP